MRSRRRYQVATFVVIFVASFALLARCNRLPSQDGRTTSTAVIDTSETALGRSVTASLVSHPGVSGIHALRDARDAFAARYLLASVAERTLDVQYYIWHNDRSGVLLMKALLDAANRGVRVRLLLDDNSTAGLDEALAAIDSHPRIEVRLFNPLATRKPRLASYLTDFARLNRRMHNKSFTADNQVTIIGGRNIGDEYFAASEGVLFADLDVIGIGPVVHDVSVDFDRYWSCESAYPVDRLIAPASAKQRAELAAKAERVEHDLGAVAYLRAIKESNFVRSVFAGTLPFEWATTRMISDPPSKVLGRAADDKLLYAQFTTIFGSPQRSVDLVSPYLVPGTSGTALFTGWAKRGVKVRVRTNSLEATDVAMVHAGYAKRRKQLLAAGITLYELRARGGDVLPDAVGRFGSSGSSLHAKTFAVDGTRVFVGSFNFDPRSARLNTEMGFVIDSPRIAQDMAAVFEIDVPAYAYRVALRDGKLEWTDRGSGREVRLRTEPGTTFWQRVGVAFLSMLPLDPLL